MVAGTKLSRRTVTVVALLVATVTGVSVMGLPSASFASPSVSAARDARPLLAWGRPSPLSVWSSGRLSGSVAHHVRTGPARWVAGPSASTRTASPLSRTASPLSRSASPHDEDVSSNWSGIVDTGTTFSEISASWTVPAVSASAQAEASGTWIGLDGASASDPTIIQTGTDQAVSGGQKAYIAWYELYPAPSMVLGGVSPGDAMAAAITNVGQGVWSLTISDVTSDESFSSDFTYSGLGESAEWVEEAPANASGQISTLADFGSVSFDDITVTAADAAAATMQQVEMVDSQGQVIAYPSSFDSSSASFTITYGSPSSETAPSQPIVNAVAPSRGSPSGGTTVVIGGASLSGATAVDFGSTPATSFDVDSDSEITATSPPGSSGTVDVTVSTPGGTSSTSSVDHFTYGLSVSRIYGQDSIGTSIAVSQAEFPSDGSAKSVVLARSDYFSDALAGGPLAVQLDGPLLVTPGASESSTLDSRVQQEIERVLPTGSTVYILGGPLAISPSVDTELDSLGYVTTRVAGSDEYATAVDIAEQLGNPSDVFETTGLDFYDALSAVPAVVALHGAILLTDGSAQAPETAAYLESHPTDTRFAIGGPLAAAGADPSATAVYGQDLYGTSAAVATTFFSSPSAFGAATSATFADALSGGPALGAERAPMLLVPPSGALPASIESYLGSVAASLVSGTLYGGPLAVGDDVLSELSTAS